MCPVKSRAIGLFDAHQPITAADAVCREIAPAHMESCPAGHECPAGMDAVFDRMDPVAKTNKARCLLDFVVYREISSFAGDDFLDWCAGKKYRPVHCNTPLDEVRRRMETSGVEILPVLDQDGRYLGSVTKTSLLEAMLRYERHLVKKTRRLLGSVDKNRKQLTAWQEIESGLRDGSRELLSVIARIVTKKEIPQRGIEVLTNIVQARYGTLSILEEQNRLMEFVYIAQEVAFVRDPPHPPPIPSTLAVPIAYAGRMYGRIQLGDKYTGQPFTVEDEELVGNFADALSLVLDHSREIEEAKRTAQRYDFLTHHDNLTGLPNREQFLEQLQRAIVRQPRNRLGIAILLLDIDNFKKVNDTLGHFFGDQLLRTVGKRIEQTIRDGDTVARLGGDEFIVLIDDMEDKRYAGPVAQKILDALARPFLLGEREIHISASIGIALYPSDGDSAEQMLKNADTAMYHAKAQGKNNHQFFAVDMNIMAERRLMLEQHLRHALKLGELSLDYQPQIDLASGEIIGVEALLRWSNPHLGEISPSQFIPVAEDTGLILPIGAWVLRTACAQAQAWHDLGWSPLRMAVNLSPRQFQQADLKETVADVLAESGLNPAFLELEITETMMMQRTESTLAILKDLKNLGIRFAMDDFGTGYSSLSYLKRFPIDVLKIDRSFVRDIGTDSDDAAIVNAIIAMSSKLKLQTIAEGVENMAQVNFLHRHRCDCAQGYFFGKPQPADRLAQALRERFAGKPSASMSTCPIYPASSAGVSGGNSMRS